MHSGSPAADQGARPPAFSVLGTEAADRGARPPGVSVVGAQASDLCVSQPGFRCVLGLLIPHSQFRV